MPPPRSRLARLLSRLPRSPGALLFALSVSAAAGCASLAGTLGLAAPSFQRVEDRPATLEVLGPSLVRLEPAARVTVWAAVRNPNDVGITLSELNGWLVLEGEEVAAVDLPLGLPLEARADTIVPLRISFDLSSLERLGGAAEAVLTRRALDYALEGRLGVDAGPLGRPVFGPRTWISGTLRVER